MIDKLISGGLLLLSVGCKFVYDAYQARKREDRLAMKLEAKIKKEMREKYGIEMEDDKESV